MGAYGVTNRATANSLYKRYKKWFKDTYGDAAAPMSFPNWLERAKRKGIVKSADGGDPTEVNIEADNGEVKVSPDVSKEVASTKNRMGRAIAATVLLLSMTAIIVMLIPTPQPVQQAPMPTV